MIIVKCPSCGRSFVKGCWVYPSEIETEEANVSLDKVELHEIYCNKCRR